MLQFSTASKCRECALFGVACPKAPVRPGKRKLCDDVYPCEPSSSSPTSNSTQIGRNFKRSRGASPVSSAASVGEDYDMSSLESASSSPASNGTQMGQNLKPSCITSSISPAASFGGDTCTCRKIDFTELYETLNDCMMAVSEVLNRKISGKWTPV